MTPMKFVHWLEKIGQSCLSVLIKTRSFTSAEIDVAMELIGHRAEGSYPKGLPYLLHGGWPGSSHRLYLLWPHSYGSGTFDLYWVAVDRNFQGQKVGSKTFKFFRGVSEGGGGRLILADASTIPHYERLRNSI